MRKGIDVPQMYERIRQWALYLAPFVALLAAVARSLYVGNA
jgi:hypothetical protein